MAEKSLTKYDKEWLRENLTVGIKGIDKTDIQPPQILLIQKTSNLTEFVDTEGKTPKVGQFFHTGKMKIYDAVDCYFVFAAKKRYFDRREDPPVQKDQYITFGILKESNTMFGMRFRSTAINALSPLFTAVFSQNVPMFAFNIKVESKEIQGDQGTWVVPAVRVGDVETDQELLNKLHKFALKFDERAESYVAEPDEDDKEEVKEVTEGGKDDTASEESSEKEEQKEEEEEEVNLDDIPF
jgi:hypothetical protein